MEVGVIERVDISAQAFPQRGGQLFLVANGGDGLEVRLDRRKTFGFDARLVHVRVIEIGDLARSGAGALGSLFNQGSGTLVAQVGKRCEDADPRPVWRNLGTLDPVAVAVQIEVIARLDRAVHVGDSDAVSVLFRGVLRVGRKKTESENSNKFKDEIKGSPGETHLQRSKGRLLGNAGPYSRREAKQEGSTTMKVRAEERAKTMGQFGRSIVYLSLIHISEPTRPY